MTFLPEGCLAHSEENQNYQMCIRDRYNRVVQKRSYGKFDIYLR